MHDATMHPRGTSAALLLACAALAACAGGAPSPEASVDRAPAAAGPYTAPERAADRALYEAKCGVCHVPFHPADFGRDEWPGIVATFAPRAGLTRAQRARVLRFLEDAAE
ncbi:MAG: hypothetical protein HMLKMBBP_03208 [Planctomycetes bacterium]|nr:hypothetical protein [Planctomycetota bacterium]